MPSVVGVDGNSAFFEPAIEELGGYKLKDSCWCGRNLKHIITRKNILCHQTKSHYYDTHDPSKTVRCNMSDRTSNSCPSFILSIFDLNHARSFTGEDDARLNISGSGETRILIPEYDKNSLTKYIFKNLLTFFKQ